MTESKQVLVYTGQAIGIIQRLRQPGTLEGRRHFLPGSLGNATSFECPVQYKSYDLSRYPEGPITLKPNPGLGKLMVETAKELEREGVKVIATDCGFYSYFQEEMAEAVNIPVCSSALIVVPLVSRLIGKNKRVGIITYDSRFLTKEHLKGVGIDESIKIAIIGYETYREKRQRESAPKEIDPMDNLEMLIEDLVVAAKQLVSKYPDIGAIVLECTSFPTAAYDIQKATGLPVFDIVMTLNWIYRAVVQKRFPPE